MATALQIEANRRNSLKSTGPRTPEGKSVSRFNALKSGIDAKAQVIPGEDAADLQAVLDDYRSQFSPATPLENFLVDALVYSDWQLRRLRKIETRLWLQIDESEEDQAALDRLTRLQRRIDATERSYFRALRELRRAQSAHPEPAEEPIQTPGPRPPAPDLDLASFLASPPELSLDLAPHLDGHPRADAVPGIVLREQPVLGAPPR